MAAGLIDGKAIAQQVRDEVRAGVEAWTAQGHEPPSVEQLDALHRWSRIP